MTVADCLAAGYRIVRAHGLWIIEQYGAYRGVAMKSRHVVGILESVIAYDQVAA